MKKSLLYISATTVLISVLITCYVLYTSSYDTKNATKRDWISVDSDRVLLGFSRSENAIQANTLGIIQVPELLVAPASPSKRIYSGMGNWIEEERNGVKIVRATVEMDADNNPVTKVKINLVFILQNDGLVLIWPNEPLRFTVFRRKTMREAFGSKGLSIIF